MKLYCIKEGTKGVVLTETKVTKGLGSSGTGYTARWADLPGYTTTKDLAFTETVVDPISVVARGTSVARHLAEMAVAGFAVFVETEPTEDRTYYIAVPYNAVEVL